MFSEFIEKIINGDVQPGYRDPQEFMSGEERDEKSDSYSYGMMLFNEISGRDYFTVSGTEEDEYFMMADPDSDGSVIDSKYIPDEYRFLSDFFSRLFPHFLSGYSILLLPPPLRGPPPSRGRLKFECPHC